MDLEPMKVEEYLNSVSYGDMTGYVPSDFALEFITFIKLVNGGEGEENKSPVLHYKMLDNVVEGNRTANMMHRGSAKLQSKSSKILTPTGWTTMGDLQVGDTVMNRNGKPTQVTFKTEPMYPRMFKMKLSDGTVLEVGDEHNHIVLRRNKKGEYSDRVLTTMQMLDEGLTHNIKPRQTTRDPKASYRFKIPLAEPMQYPEATLPLCPYLIGLMIANGNYKGGMLSCHVNDLLELMGSVSNSGANNTYGNASRFYVGKDMFHWLGDVTSRNKSIPKICLFASLDQRIELLRGLMDGDGTISQNGSSSYSTYSLQLAHDVKELVQSLGGISTIQITYKKSGGIEYTVRVQLKMNPFKLQRKAAKWKPSIKISRSVVSIEEFTCQEEGYCIQVGCPTESYITEGYVLTHNTTVMAEYLFLYLAVYGELPGFGKIQLAIYVSDSIENGVKNLRKNIEFRYEKSEFLKHYIPDIRLTDIRLEFKNKDGQTFIVKMYGAKTGVRGAKEMGKRPTLAVLDDLISDEDARSATVIESIEATVYKAVTYALHPTKNKIIWSGTPFNAKDPLYKAVESGAWKVNVFPVCEEFPCERKDFKGSWPDRFTYDSVKAMYDVALKAGKIDGFNQEMMLRIMSDEDRLITDSDIQWYSRSTLLKNKGKFNFYITTDFATSAKAASDFSVISVWAINHNGDWYWVDGTCRKQTMDKNVDDLFKWAQIYKPSAVGVEISGQQGGFIPWINDQMMVRNTYFTLASEGNKGMPGIRPNTDKMTRFQLVVPWFKTHKIHFPTELKLSPEMVQCMDELTNMSAKGTKSKHDDFSDTISMLAFMNAWKPGVETEAVYNDEVDIWEFEKEENNDQLSSYLV